MQKFPEPLSHGRVATQETLSPPQVPQPSASSILPHRDRIIRRPTMQWQRDGAKGVARWATPVLCTLREPWQVIGFRNLSGTSRGVATVALVFQNWLAVSAPLASDWATEIAGPFGPEYLTRESEKKKNNILK